MFGRKSNIVPSADNLGNYSIKKSFFFSASIDSWIFLHDDKYVDVVLGEQWRFCGSRELPPPRIGRRWKHKNKQKIIWQYILLQIVFFVDFFCFCHGAPYFAANQNGFVAVEQSADSISLVTSNRYCFSSVLSLLYVLFEIILNVFAVRLGIRYWNEYTLNQNIGKTKSLTEFDDELSFFPLLNGFWDQRNKLCFVCRRRIVYSYMLCGLCFCFAAFYL